MWDILLLLAVVGSAVAAAYGTARFLQGPPASPMVRVAALPAPVRPPPPPVCPVPRASREWIEESLQWLADQFGLEAARRDLALPMAEFYPDPYTVNWRVLRTLMRRICPVMGVDPWFVVLVLSDMTSAKPSELHPGRPTAGRYTPLWDFSLVQIDRGSAADPLVAAAVIAHELGHVRLIGEGRLTVARKDHERLADLVTIYLGMGLFTAGGGCTRNPHAPTTMHLGYLTCAEHGYALACLARLRKEHDPVWAEHLPPVARSSFRKSTDYLDHRHGRLDSTLPEQHSRRSEQLPRDGC